jgi:CHRD domain/PEP-CTERM motif
MNGFASAPRPIEIAAHPVSRNVAAASARVRMSPLPTTGIRSTAATTARMPARLTLPLNPCSRVLPWMMTPATPTFSNSRASAGALKVAAFQPSRILTVTGTVTALTTAATSRTAASVWHIRAEPPPVLTTLLTGQPMFGTYINIHTTVFPAGEIRGQIVSSAIPEPTSLVLLGLGLVGVAGLALRTARGGTAVAGATDE